MKNAKTLSAGRYWLPIFAVGAVSLLLSIFGVTKFGKYEPDTQNIQKIQVFQTLSDNALFLSEKAVTGDVSAIEALSNTTLYG